MKARVAELEQVVARRAEQWEPDGSSMDDYAGGPVSPLPWEDYVPSDTGGDADGSNESDFAQGLTDDEDEEDWDGDETPPEATSWDVDETAAARMAESEEAEASTDAETASDDAPGLSSDTGPELHLDRFDRADDPMPAGGETQDRLDGSGLTQDADAILDEDALRDLVTEIVRQELQGALGERITRNVRKLVRREIHRALASQELE